MAIGRLIGDLQAEYRQDTGFTLPVRDLIQLGIWQQLMELNATVKASAIGYDELQDLGNEVDTAIRQNKEAIALYQEGLVCAKPDEIKARLIGVD